MLARGSPDPVIRAARSAAASYAQLTGNAAEDQTDSPSGRHGNYVRESSLGAAIDPPNQPLAEWKCQVAYS
jgi:hypothetical protein